MIYRNLGRSGLKLSRIVLGTMNFGMHTSEEESFAILDAALDAGINVIDTADYYGGEKHPGRTEEIIGRWLHLSGKRDRVVLATKVFGPMSSDINDRGLSAFHIRRAVEASLRRLQTDHIDLYQMHHIDRETPWEEVSQALETLIADGKITYVGSSNFAGWHLARAAESARQRGTLGLISEQSIYNLLTRDIEREVIPAAANYDIGLLSWSPLGGGLLAGGQGVRRTAERQGLDAMRTEQIERWLAFCGGIADDPGKIALAWLLHQPGVHGPIVGPRTVAQLSAALESLNVELDSETLGAIDRIFPGPGCAPEGYAW